MMKGGKKGWHVCEGGSLSSRSTLHSLKDEEETLLWPWTLHKLYVSRVQFYCTSTAATPCQTQVSPVQQNTCAHFFSLVRHSQKHVCLQNIFFQSYMDVTALSLSIQELVFWWPRDVFLCLYQGNKWNSVGLKC